MLKTITDDVAGEDVVQRRFGTGNVFDIKQTEGNRHLRFAFLCSRETKGVNFMSGWRH